MRKKRILRIVIITSILMCLFFIGLYIYGIRSEPYSVAVNYLTHDEKISKELGPLISYRLALWGYSIRYEGPHGRAEYEILVKGKKQKAKIYLYMEKSAGIWEIVEANMVLEDGKTISLVK